MENIGITSISSRGQVVIPRGLRDSMGINEGEKFVVIGEDDTIVLKKLEVPSFSGVDKLLMRTREFAKKKGMSVSDVEMAISEARKK